jgi:hypothetical protein
MAPAEGLSQKTEGRQGVPSRRLAAASFIATVIAISTGCASGPPNLSARAGDIPASVSYAGLGFKDLPSVSLEQRKLNLRVESSRRGLIKRVIRTPTEGVAAALISDTADWCKANGGEPLKSSEIRELTNKVEDILTAEYNLFTSYNIRSSVCRSAGTIQVVLSTERTHDDHQFYIVWMTDAEVSAANPTIVADRKQLSVPDETRKADERNGQPDLIAENQKKLETLNAEFARLDRRMYRLLKERGAKAPVQNAATAASATIADSLGLSPDFSPPVGLEQLVGRTAVARLVYFANGACTLRAFRPYYQSAVDLRKVKWDVAYHSIHTITEHFDFTGTSIPGEGVTVVRFNLLGVAVDVDSVDDATRVLKSAQVIAIACAQQK